MVAGRFELGAGRSAPVARCLAADSLLRHASDIWRL